MFKDSKAFSGFSVDDPKRAKAFYGDVLGLETTDVEGMEEYGLFRLRLGGGADVLVYPKPDHSPASFTILNFPVGDIEQAVGALTEKGVRFLRYDAFAADQDDHGIFRGGGPLIAWFEDPAGNVLSVLEQDE